MLFVYFSAPAVGCFDDDSGWIKKFECRRKANQKKELTETAINRQRRMDREREPKKINDNRRLSLLKKSAVFRWTAPETPPAGMQVHVELELQRVQLWGGDIKPGKEKTIGTSSELMPTRANLSFQ